VCSQVDAKAFSGLMVRVWDKHTFRRDGFMGQVTIKFNTELLDGEEAIDQWFDLRQRGKKEDVSGSIRLRINYGDLKKEKKSEKERKSRVGSGGGDSSSEDDRDEEEEKDKKPLALSQNYHKADPRLERSTHVQIDEDEATEDADAETHYEPARKGKAELAKLNKDTKVSLSNKNLEVV
jgi:hypothetical protein